MDAAAQDSTAPVTQASIPRTLDAFLAGLQAGTLGVMWMLAWTGLCAMWLRRSFWAPENLLASVFHPDSNITIDFSGSTLSGLALYLLVYGLAGAGFAVLAVRQPMRPARTVLLAVLMALAWYYFSFHLLWRTVSPSIAFLNAERPAVLGHVIYGLVLGRFHTYLPRDEKRATEVVETETNVPAP
jgi:hypothetical protein